MEREKGDSKKYFRDCNTGPFIVIKIEDLSYFKISFGWMDLVL